MCGQNVVADDVPRDKRYSTIDEGVDANCECLGVIVKISMDTRSNWDVPIIGLLA